MQNTKIQWCDGTVSPVPTCDGCPLRLPEAAVQREIRDRLHDEHIGTTGIETAIQAYLGSNENSRRKRILAAFMATVPSGASKREERIKQLTREVYKATSSCYAGVLTDNRGGKVKGYADRFEQITLFPGRMELAARVSPPRDLRRPDKPWLDGCRQLWFVNDMGDALSNDVPFEFLYNEIVKVATSENGRRSMWLWLTKRPKRMADFFRWLVAHGVTWPENLVPMTSVLHRMMAKQVKHLLDIPAVVRGLSVEPLWESVEPDLRGIGWVIVGGESGPLSRPFELAWARSLREQCRAANVPFFVKQLGANRVDGGGPIKLANSHGGDWNEWPQDLRIREVPTSFVSGSQSTKAQLTMGQ